MKTGTYTTDTFTPAPKEPLKGFMGYADKKGLKMIERAEKVILNRGKKIKAIIYKLKMLLIHNNRITLDDIDEAEEEILELIRKKHEKVS